MSEEKQTIHVLLVYPLDDNETYIHLFRNKQSVKEYLADTIRQDYLETYGELDDDGKKELETIIADMEKSMDENGYWNDECNHYDYQERELEDKKEA